MKLKTNPNNYMLQIGDFLYDYKYEGGVEKVIVVYIKNMNYYTIYNLVGSNLVLAFTNMNNSDISKYMNDLYKNYEFIIRTGREDLR